MLIINNSEKFANNIWQYNADFTETQWKESIDNFADNLQE